MMTATPTVRDLFASAELDRLAAGESAPELPSGLAGLVTGFEWQGLAGRVLDLLDLNVVDVMLGGWKKHREVRDELRATAVDPSKTVLVNLATHTIKSAHKPSIQVRTRGQVLFELSCPIELVFEVGAAELMIRGGDVHEIRTGNVKVRGTVKIERTKILERELAALPLPGRILRHVDTPAMLAASEDAVAVM